MRLNFYQNMDSHPFAGKRIIEPPIKVKLLDSEHMKHYFNGSTGYERITNLTPGHVYEIFEIEGFGDVADAVVIGDNGQPKEIMCDLLVEVE